MGERDNLIGKRMAVKNCEFLEHCKCKDLCTSGRSVILFVDKIEDYEDEEIVIEAGSKYVYSFVWNYNKIDRLDDCMEDCAIGDIGAFVIEDSDFEIEE
jgi:hypothetical protein